ncbi:MAG: hypothetical protein C0403_19440 [Desulfobacterium sp.]|nr:hypothetical protein [Desulfobacterium sp.]
MAFYGVLSFPGVVGLYEKSQIRTTLKLRILLIPEYSTESTGGARTFFYKLLDIHRSLNLDTKILIEQYQMDTQVAEKCKQYGIPIITIPDRSKKANLPIYSLPYEIKYILKVIKQEKPNLVVVSNKAAGINLGVFLRSIPVIFIMHGYPLGYLRIWQSFAMRLIGHFFSSSKKRFVTVSKYSAARIRKYMSVPEKNIDVIYNSYHPAIIHPPCLKQPIVLTVANVVDYKNPLLWLDVAKKVIAQIESVRFLWLGDGDMLEHMRQEVRDSGLEKIIQFIGHVDNVGEYYAKSSVYFQPSLIESHGMSVVEAMANGLPCVVSDTGGLPESVINGETGYIRKADDAKSFAEKISACLNDPYLCQRLGRAGKTRAHTLFNSGFQNQKIINLYKKVAAS